ncbi:MAG: DNA adenine methylase [Caldilinea sp. CFX5]|nr:DNA adenine methylase [Caldilinea sp. CFX5]
MKKLPQPIPYQGSKRGIAPQILKFLPPDLERFVEPFAGSAALSIAASYGKLAQRFWLNDLNRPLVNLLRIIIEQPTEIADQYQRLWQEQLGRERVFYDEVRDKFNRTQAPDLFLYLLARCVKASVRYNTNGEFNQAPDNRRKGRHPLSMREEILAFSRLLYGKTTVTALDFRQMLDDINPKRDFVYLDPPYQGTSGTRDARYCSGVALSALIEFLDKLNQRNVMFALSYDGIKGDKTYGKELPVELQLYQILIEAGRSTQSTLLGQIDTTYESLYLSPVLITKLGIINNQHQTKVIPTLSTPQKTQLQFNFL